MAYLWISGELVHTLAGRWRVGVGGRMSKGDLTCADSLPANSPLAFFLWFGRDLRDSRSMYSLLMLWFRMKGALEDFGNPSTVGVKDYNQQIFCNSFFEGA